MAKISSYSTDNTPSLSDKLIGTDTADSNNTKNYTLGQVGALINENTQYVKVLTGTSTITQAPSSLGVALQVSFGAAQGISTDAVMIDSSGTITFNQVGTYLLNGFGNIERQGSSGGVAVLLFRFLVGGVQSGSVKGVHLDTTGVSVPYEITMPITITTVGTTVEFQIMRDASGVNFGGLSPHTNTSGWSAVPSAEVNIWKLT
jgi:hypothetical protein